MINNHKLHIDGTVGYQQLMNNYRTINNHKLHILFGGGNIQNEYKKRVCEVYR